MGVAAPAGDGVEVGDVQMPERMQREQADSYPQRVAAMIGKRAAQRLIERAPAQPGVHDLAVHQVDHRNEFEA
ncbi:hypothetical protein GALL_537320 [mine drainage metagenome]|uniref:Uncharacterized protein n=1 Tax=mine drainage metagenome TaxID=410659 RepID=A0A1J5PB66_9ZZZZ